MKCTALLLLFFSSPVICIAQSGRPDLKTLLQDSTYLFNRYDEMTTGMSTEIDDWNVPTSFKSTTKSVLSGVAKNLDVEKPRLYDLLSKSDVSASDLFDVYSEVEDLSTELSELSSNFADFGSDQEKAVELAKLGSKASILAQNIGFVLQEKIMDMEYQLAACKIKSSPAPAKQK